MGILGNAIRVVHTAGPPRLYLTFDDGPHPDSTRAVLATLERLDVPATFFLVAKAARQQAPLVRQIVQAGHAIGNHSSDHAYGHFFRGRRHMRDWVAQAERDLAQVAGQPTVGFRPPAGVRTPELAWALRELDLPLVIWRMRFFDSTIPWKPLWAEGSLRFTPPGAIVLLHDRQSAARQAGFLATLEGYVAAARARGFTFAALSRPLLRPS